MDVPKRLLSLLAGLAMASHAGAADLVETALADLAEARRVLQQVHPAAVSGMDPGFARWLEEGYAPAQRRARQISRREQLLPTLRWYLTGFEDGHVSVFDPQATGDWSWAGWTAQWRGGELQVTHAANSWPVPTPPVGARLRSCDGTPVLPYLEHQVAPFIDRRMALESVRDQLSLLLHYRHPALALWNTALPAHCSFEVDGRTSAYKQHWGAPQAGPAASPEPLRLGVEPWGSRRHWVHARQFLTERLAPDEAERAIAQVHAIPADAELVVFDTRGNQGGNSLYGDRLVQALLRQATPVVAPDAYALWRPSRTALAWFEHAARDEETRSGPDSPNHRWLVRIAGLLRQAHDSTGPDVLVSDAGLWDRAASPPADGPPYTGRVVLVTDRNCASACLNFADLVRAVPGALHVGEPTSADTQYMDVTFVTLPSGLRMMVPQKQWMNRPRGSNRPHVPHHRYDGDIRDTAALRAWLATLLP